MALLIEGNRKGLTVPIKEQGQDRNWVTRHVNTYCARAFSAIRIPDPTMASKMIFLPLLRPPDKSKGNIDPMELENWPCDRRQLIDDLWALVLWKLPVMLNWDKWVGTQSKLVGRNLQPWRSVLAVAAWLQRCGLAGLYERIEKLSQDYQQEHPELEIADSDMTNVVIQALCKCTKSAVNANNSNRPIKQVIVKVLDVTETAKSIIEEEELDLDPYHVSNKRVGRILAELRFPEHARQGGQESRMREIDLRNLAELAESYKVDFYENLAKLGISLDRELPANSTNGTDGVNGSGKIIRNTAHDSARHTHVPETACSLCSHTEFWQRSDGSWICSTSHPNPAIR